MRTRNVGFGPSPAGLPTVSGAEYVLDRGVGQVQHHPGQIIIDSTATDTRRNPSTTLEKGLALGKVTASGRWKGYLDSNSDGTQVARGVLDEVVDLLDENGTAQHYYGASMVIRAAIDKAKVFDQGGTAIDSAGLTDIGLLTNGCAIISGF